MLSITRVSEKAKSVGSRDPSKWIGDKFLLGKFAKDFQSVDWLEGLELQCSARA